MIDLQELARHQRLARIHRWRMAGDNDPAYRREEEAKAARRQAQAAEIEARNAADLALGIRAGDRVVIGDYEILTLSLVRVNLMGTPAVVIALKGKPMGGYLGVVEVVQQVPEVRAVTVHHLRAAHARGEKIRSLGAVQRTAARVRYLVPLSSLLMAETAPRSEAAAVLNGW